jgi:hypothetical protein
MKKIISAVLILTVFCFAECKKNKVDSNGLPAATQEGKNTLGFLLNGQPWKPQGNNGTANLSIDYDDGINNGGMGISAYRIISENEREYFKIGIIDSLNPRTAPFSINLTNKALYRIGFTNNQCSIFSFDNTQVNGIITVTKLDRTNRIIAGTFNATLNKTGCSEIKITDGRFDMKF